MHDKPVHYHGYGYDLWDYHGPHMGSYPSYVYYLPVPYCMKCQRPSHFCACTDTSTTIIPQEFLVMDDPESSPTTREIFTGGISDARLTLEYRANDSPAPETAAVEVTITDPDGTETHWQSSPVPDGFNLKSDFPTTAPGSRVTIIVTEAMARLRWCEELEC